MTSAGPPGGVVERLWNGVLRLNCEAYHRPQERRSTSSVRGKGVIGVEIVIVESEADKVDPELVRHVP